jgi:hypothetical protein
MPPTKNWDEEIIAKDMYGESFKGWIWPAGLSYIISAKKYFETGKMAARVKRTVEAFGIKETYHLDVLTSEPLRFDFDPKNPVPPSKMHKYRLAIIEEFNKYGIDITSECTLHPFVGKAGAGMWYRRNDGNTLFYGERLIPLVAFVYHGASLYCGSPEGCKSETINSLIEGAQSYFDIECEIEPKHLDDIYLLNMPMRNFYDLQIQNVTENDGTVTVDYGNGSYVAANRKEYAYAVYANGRMIAKNFTTFAPVNGGYLAYAQDGGSIEYPFDGTAAKARVLTKDGEGGEVAVTVTDGKIKIVTEPHTPVKITVL